MTEPTKRLAVISSNVRGGFFRTLDRRAAMRAATKAPQRKRPCRSRALPVDLSSPSLNPLYGRAFASGAARSRYRIACCGQGNRPVAASCAHPARWNSLLDLFAARLTVPSARMHPASQAGHGPVAPALFIARRDELLSVRTSTGGSVCGRPLYSLPWSSVCPWTNGNAPFAPKPGDGPPPDAMLLDHVKQRALLALPHSGSDGRQDIPQLRSIGAGRGFACSPSGWPALHVFSVAGANTNDPLPQIHHHGDRRAQRARLV